jgi:hypothetical protein
VQSAAAAPPPVHGTGHIRPGAVAPGAGSSTGPLHRPAPPSPTSPAVRLHDADYLVLQTPDQLSKADGRAVCAAHLLDQVCGQLVHGLDSVRVVCGAWHQGAIRACACKQECQAAH